MLKQITKAMVFSLLTFLSLLFWISKNNGGIPSFSIFCNVLFIEKCDY